MQFGAEIVWERGDQNFLGNRYSRRHVMGFDGGARIPASSSPHVVPVPMSDPSAVDPEEAFVASLSSCHMLWFLSIAATRRFCVDRYVDSAIGHMEKNAEGKLFVSVVTLRPNVTFSGDRIPSTTEIDRLHHKAHEACFIASSVRTDVRCEPIY